MGHSENVLGPDYFGFYSREISELFSQSEDAFPLSVKRSDATDKQPEVSRKSSLPKSRLNGIRDYKAAGSAPLFSDAVGSKISDFTKERLKTLVRQCVFSFSKEVDSVLAAVLGICRVQSVIRYKESLTKLPVATKDAKEEDNPPKKQKVLASVAMDDDLRFLLDNESSKVEELVKKYSAQHLATIAHMKQKVEEFVDLLLSNFRPMTLSEKQQLQKLIQKLPPKNLDRVVEIIQHGRPNTKEIHVDLEKQSKVTLWRLYFFVEAVENARKLCQDQ